MNSLPRQLFIPSSSPWAINRPISLLPSIICLAPNVWVLQENENAPQHSCKGNTPANAWSVVPPMWQAAAPALAVIKVLWGGNIVIKRFKRYDLPVPALPVKNTLFPALMAFITAICSGIFEKTSKSWDVFLPLRCVRRCHNSNRFLYLQF